MKSDALIQAIYTRLTTYAPVNSAVNGVYTYVPQDPESEDASAFPYITINGVSLTPDDSKTENGIIALFDIAVWSRSKSALTWRGIASDVYDALQKYDLSVTGVNVIDCRFDASNEVQSPDGITNSHVTTIRVLYRST